MRGLEIKEDTYALLKVVRADGSELELFDSSSETGRSAQYTNFILQSVSEARMEKHQIVETFGEPYIFFFGEHPRFLDVQMVLINSHDFNWEAEFWQNYNDYLRGTKLVEMGARTYLFYDDVVVEGYWLQAQGMKTSDSPLMVQISFRLFLTNYSNVSLVGDPAFPIRSSVNLPPDVDLTAADGFTLATKAVEAAGAAASDESLALMAAQGGAQQAGGFGGGRKLSDALRGGLAANSDISGVLQNAAAVMGNFDSFRKAPVRGQIADNFDEFTQLPPAPPEPAAEDQDGEMTAVDSLPASAVQAARRFGADIDNPGALASLGLGVSFLAAGGLGLRGGVAGQATFGVVAAARGGIGFTGEAFAVASAEASAAASFSGGVQVGGGISGGVGVGGGIAGGLQGNTQGVLTGAASFQGGPDQASSYGGVGLGASVVVGGAPSAFALVAVEGTLDAAATYP